MTFARIACLWRQSEYVLIDLYHTDVFVRSLVAAEGSGRAFLCLVLPLLKYDLRRSLSSEIHISIALAPTGRRSALPAL